MHDDFARTAIIAADRNVLRRQRNDLPFDSDLPVVVGRHRHSIAGLAASGSAKTALSGCASDPIRSASSEVISERSPWPTACTRFSQARRRGNSASHASASAMLERTYQMFIWGDIGKAEGAEQPFAAIGELRIDEARMRAQLIAHLRDRRFHGCAKSAPTSTQAS